MTTLTCDRSGTQILVENFTDGDIYVTIGTEGNWSLDSAVRIPADMFRAIEAYETENRVQCSAYNALRVRADVDAKSRPPGCDVPWFLTYVR